MFFQHNEQEFDTFDHLIRFKNHLGKKGFLPIQIKNTFTDITNSQLIASSFSIHSSVSFIPENSWKTNNKCFVFVGVISVSCSLSCHLHYSLDAFQSTPMRQVLDFCIWCALSWTRYVRYYNLNFLRWLRVGNTTTQLYWIQALANPDFTLTTQLH